MEVTEGKYKARQSGEVVLGKSKDKGTPFIETYFEIIDGPCKGELVRWTGYFANPKNSKRTIQSLQYCGWDGDDLDEFADGEAHGLDANEVDIDVEMEEWESTDEETGETETKTRPRVAWINRPGGFLNVQNAMKPEEARAFGESMKGLVLKLKGNKAREERGDTSFPYGANAPTESEPKKTGTGGRKF